MVSPHYLEYCFYRAFIRHILIGLGEGFTPIDFEFFTSRVKVTRVTFVKNGFHSLSCELFITELSYVMCWLLLVRTIPLMILVSLGQSSRSKWSLVKQFNHGFRSLSWELFITEISYFTCWLVLMTWPLLILSSVRQRVKPHANWSMFEHDPLCFKFTKWKSRLHGSLVIIYVNSFYWTS